MDPSNGQLCPGGARLDLYAAGLSSLCLIHCLALPLLVTLMPLAAMAENELVHRVLVLAAVPVSLRVIWKTLPADRNWPFVGAVLSGLGLLLAALIGAVSEYEESLTVAGGTLLCAAHLWHWTRQRGKGVLHGLPAGADQR